MNADSGSRETIGGYEVLDELARGGMGVVYRARDPRTGSLVAIKLVLAEQHDRRFQREVEALQRLDHPGILRVVAAGEDAGRAYLATELVEGETLEDHLERTGSLEPRRAVEVARDLALALEYAHQRGVIHRDVKPANVLLGRDGSIRLADFGLVRQAAAGPSSLTGSGQLLGTPGYFSPEQVQGAAGTIGPGADVYGLGATLYAALTRQPPFVSHSLAGYAIATVSAAPAPPSKFCPGLDPRIEAVCLRCLEKRPEDRYPSAAALALALETCLAKSKPRVQPLLWAAAATVALAVGGVSAAKLWHGRQLNNALEHSRALLAEGDAKAALAALPEAAGHTTVHVARARAYRALGRLEPSVAEFERAHALEPDNGALWIEHADLLLHFSATQEALKAVERALALAPGRAKAVGLRGRIQLKLGAFSAAEADLTQALEFETDDPGLWHARGLARLKSEDLSNAGSDLDRAVQLAPDDGLVLLQRAYVRVGLSAYREALTDLDRTRELDPGLAGPLMLRARTRFLLGEYSGAEEDASEAARLNPGNDDAVRMRALIRAARGDREGALADLRHARELDGSDGYTTLWLAGLGGDNAAEFEEGDLRPAWLETVRDVLLGRRRPASVLVDANEPGQACVLSTYLGVWSERRGDPHAARSWYRKAVETNTWRWTQHDWAIRRLADMKKPSGR